MQTIGIFKGDIINTVLVVTIILDIFILATPYWVKIENAKNDRLYDVGIWEICAYTGEPGCYRWSDFFNASKTSKFLDYWPEMTNYLSATLFFVTLINKTVMIVLPYLPRMVKSYSFFMAAMHLFYFNLLNIAGLLCFYYGFEYFTRSLKCREQRATYLFDIERGLNFYFGIVSIILTMIYSIVMNVLYAQIRWTSIPVANSLLYKLKIHTKPTLRSQNKQASIKYHSSRYRYDSDSTCSELSPPDSSLIASTPAAIVTLGTIGAPPKFNFKVAKSRNFLNTSTSTPTPSPKPKARLTRVRFDIEETDGGRPSQIEREKTPPPSEVKRVI